MQCSPAILAAKGQLFAALIINVRVHSSAGTYLLPSHCHTASTSYLVVSRHHESTNANRLQRRAGERACQKLLRVSIKHDPLRLTREKLRHMQRGMLRTYGGPPVVTSVWLMRCDEIEDRRVLCDRIKPTCLQCLRSERLCKGYGMRLSWPRAGNKRRAIVVNSARPEVPTEGKALRGLVHVSSYDVGMHYWGNDDFPHHKLYQRAQSGVVVVCQGHGEKFESRRCPMAHWHTY
jgi:hypothetical protein